MPMTTWPMRSFGTLVRRRAAAMAMPPSWVAEKRGNRPGARLPWRRSARGRRRPPSRMRIASCPMAPPLLVQEDRRYPGPVLDEVPHADVHVDRALAAPEAPALHAESLGEGEPQPLADHVHQDGVDGERAVAQVHGREALGDGQGSRVRGPEPHLA